MVAINSVSVYNPNFKSYKHTIKNKCGMVINRGDTCFFRGDLDYDYLIDFLRLKYKDVDKVNVLAHACSNGLEAYSFLTKMIEMLKPKDAVKFLPFVARDIEEEHINLAKNGVYSIDSTERGRIDFFLKDKFYDFFEPTCQDNTVKVSKYIKNLVTFSKGNLLDDVKNINFDNTVLFARNCWRYLDEEDADKLAMTLSHRMDKSSTLVIGDFDKQFNFDKKLYVYGFKESAFVQNVFEKRK